MEPLCDVSIYAFVADLSRFDRIDVSVICYYSNGFVPILFVNKSAYEH